MQTKVKKWGNSLGIRIPQSLAESLGITEETIVELSAENNMLTLRPVKTKESLSDVVGRITVDNRHGELDWDEPKGREVW